MRTTLLSALLLAGHAAAATKIASYNVELNDQSPLITYNPPVGNPDPVDGSDPKPLDPNAWNVTYTANSWSSWKKWTIGFGKSYHWAPKGASLTISWLGTGINIQGYNVGRDNFVGEAELTVDGQRGQCNGNTAMIQCNMSGLADTTHTATLLVKQGVVTVSTITLAHDFASDVSDTSKAEIVTLNAYDNGAISSDVRSDGFIAKSQWDGNGGVVDTDYPRMYANTGGAYAEVTVPRKTSLVEIVGSVDIDHGRYKVEVHPAPPNGNETFFGNSFNPWTTRDQILFFTNLDPDTQYTVRFTHLETDDSMYSDVSAFKFIKVPQSNNSDSSSSGISAGAIAGIVVGVVLGLIVVGLLIFIFCRRRKRNEASTSHPLRGTIDGEEPIYGPQPTPLTLQSGGHNSTHSNDPLLATGNRNGFSPVSPYTSAYTASSSDPYGDHTTETNSVTTAGYAGLGAGGHESLLPPVALTKAQMARQSVNGGRGPLRHVYNHHSDAGSVIHNPDTDTVVEDIPPSYNPEWASSGGGPSEAGERNDLESSLSSPRR